MISHGLIVSRCTYRAAGWRYYGVLRVNYGLILVMPINEYGCLPGMGIFFVAKISGCGNITTLQDYIDLNGMR